uniref:thiol oxidase n=1 Tax=viral metagenome TaxID=1070528 RepID=A0A6C0AGP7_9ZZZZ|tara:strand:+ start:1358 stop:1816 length:459 start_codon:yes stop_codon:yes gene_type:complete
MSMASKSNITISPKIWGPPLWDILHYITFVYEPKNSVHVNRLFTYHLPNLMPCRTCRENYKKHIVKYPIRLESSESLSKWLVRIHNETNKRLNKKQVKYIDVKRKYLARGSKERVNRNFFKWAQIVREYVVHGSPRIQRSYSILMNYIVTKV